LLKAFKIRELEVAARRREETLLLQLETLKGQLAQVSNESPDYITTEVTGKIEIKVPKCEILITWILVIILP
jgi:hypothetical protein